MSKLGGRARAKRLSSDSQNDVADLLLRVHVPMGLDHILERIGAVDHDSKSTEVRFRSDTYESRLEAWCSAGQIQSAVREESS